MREEPGHGGRELGWELTAERHGRPLPSRLEGDHGVRGEAHRLPHLQRAALDARPLGRRSRLVHGAYRGASHGGTARCIGSGGGTT
eukprot:scaffold73369_cov75-Phaeocystis_antarctica.AAC.2